MLFLNEVYRQIYLHYFGKINHFPLIRLLLYSLDKTIFYFFVFLIIRGLYLYLKQKKINWRHELLLDIFIIYLLLLFFLTVFRHGYFPWEFHIYWHRSLLDVNWRPLVQTWKLMSGKSILDFVYNLGGNIFWFIPWGMLYPLLYHPYAKMGQTAVSGMLVSILIESLQFILFTGISDIDDVIFNTIGAICGYLLYYLLHFLLGFHENKS